MTDGLIRYSVRHGISFMPFFRKTEISAAELARWSNTRHRSQKRNGTPGARRGHSLPTRDRFVSYGMDDFAEGIQV